MKLLNNDYVCEWKQQQRQQSWKGANNERKKVFIYCFIKEVWERGVHEKKKNILMMCKLPPRYFSCFTILCRCLLLLINIKLDVFASWYVISITIIVIITISFVGVLNKILLKVLMSTFFLLLLFLAVLFYVFMKSFNLQL